MKFHFSFVVISLFIFFSLQSKSQTLDTNFSPVFAGVPEVYALLKLADGRMLVAGNFYSAKGQLIKRTGLICLTATGAIDISFNVGEGISFGRIYEMRQQIDGKIILVGSFTSFNGDDNIKYITRLNIDGSIDTSFNSGASLTGSPLLINAVSIQSDGKILIYGPFSSYNGVTRRGMARLNIDGSLDQNFNPNMNITSFNNRASIVVQNDGKILVCGGFNLTNQIATPGLVRLNIDGTVDGSFVNALGSGFNGDIFKVALQNNGKIILLGSFTSVNGLSYNKLVRLNSDGTVDASFNNNVGFNSGNTPESILILPNDELIIGGHFQSPSVRIVRLNSNGLVDNTFNTGNGIGDLSSTVFPEVTCLSLQSDGNLVAGGTFSLYNQAICLSLVRITPNGSRDTSYQPDLGGLATIGSVLPSIDGKIYVAGDFLFANGNYAPLGVVRLNSDGSVDNGFTLTGFTGSAGTGSILKLDNQGRLLVGGQFSYVYNSKSIRGLARFNSNGSIDNTFSSFLGVTALYSTDGVLDIDLELDGKIIIGGAFTKVNSQDIQHLARLHVDGSLDTEFNSGNNHSNAIKRIDKRLSDGKLILAQRPYGGGSVTAKISLVNPNGTKDNGFLAEARFEGPEINDAVFTSTGSLLVGGNFTKYNGLSVKKLIKLNDVGDIDATFNFMGGLNGYNVSTLTRLNSSNIAVGKFGVSVDKNSVDVIDENGKLIYEDLKISGNLITGFAETDNELYVFGKISSADDQDITSIARFNRPSGPLESPMNLTSSTNNDPRRNTLSWIDNSSGELGFEIQRSDVNNTNFITIAYTKSNTQEFVDEVNLLPLTQYHYRVKATNIYGTSNFSNESFVSTLPVAPAIPTGLQLEVLSSTSLKLKWNSSSDIVDQYEIYRSENDNSSYIKIDETPLNDFLDEGLNSNTNYFYKIRAVNTGGASEFSDEVNQLITDIELKPTFNIVIYPNPTSDILIIENSAREFLPIEIFTSMGKSVYKFEHSNPMTDYRVDMSQWANGLYILRIGNKRDIEAIKIIKQ